MNHQSTRILIVDDDVETCRLIEELIAAPGTITYGDATSGVN